MAIDKNSDVAAPSVSGKTSGSHNFQQRISEGGEPLGGNCERLTHDGPAHASKGNNIDPSQPLRNDAALLEIIPEAAPLSGEGPLYTEEELKAEGLKATTTNYGKEGRATMYSKDETISGEGRERKLPEECVSPTGCDHAEMCLHDCDEGFVMDGKQQTPGKPCYDPRFNTPYAKPVAAQGRDASGCVMCATGRHPEYGEVEPARMIDVRGEKKMRHEHKADHMFTSPCSPARSASFEQAVTELLEAMETCHICKASLLLEREPIHCQDCSSNCEGHDGPECTTITLLHARVKQLLLMPPARSVEARHDLQYVLDALVYASEALGCSCKPSEDGPCISCQLNHSSAIIQGIQKRGAALPGSLPSPAPQPKPIDGKFGVLGDRLVNLVSGEAIPEDEPLFLLRARDHHALRILTYYRGVASEDCNDLHLAGIQQVIDKFSRFAKEHPERMKQPGLTRHLKLDQSGPSLPSEERWYTKEELHDVLIGKNYEPVIADELAGWIADMLQGAYDKGRSHAAPSDTVRDSLNNFSVEKVLANFPDEPPQPHVIGDTVREQPAERISDGAYSECSDEAVNLLATIENADYEEGCEAVFELRKLLPNLDRYVKDEVAVVPVPGEPDDVILRAVDKCNPSTDGERFCLYSIIETAIKEARASDPQKGGQFLRCPKCFHVEGFERDKVWETAVRWKCVECGSWSTREEWGLEPLPVPPTVPAGTQEDK